MLGGGGGPESCVRGIRRASRLFAALVAPMLAGASCSHDAPAAAVLDAGKVASVVVGRSSRTDVFAALGQPSRTERSALGEAWVYEAKTGDAGGNGLMTGVSAAAGVVGAFVPYVGLVGSGLGLAGVAMDGMRAEPQAVMLAVIFRDDGVVRDCTYSSAAAPAGVAGSAATRQSLWTANGLSLALYARYEAARPSRNRIDGAKPFGVDVPKVHL